MAVTRIKNNQITDAVNGNVQPGINAAAKLQNYSITSTKLANSLVYGSDLTVSGNLTVNGTTTTIDTVNTLIEDPIITLADGQTSGAPTVDIGILGLRGNQNSSFLGWNEANTEFAAVLSNTTASNTTVNITSYGNFKANSITAQGDLSVVGNIVGSVNFSGNVTAGNFLTAGLISATGTITSAANVIGGNLTTNGEVSAAGNITGANVNTGNISLSGNVISNLNVTGNIEGGNVATAGTVSSAGNVTGGNILTGGIVSATGNITTANSINTSNISLSGNVISDLNVTGNVAGGNILTSGIVSATGTITSAANITGGNILTAGLVSATGNVTAGNIDTAGLITATGNITGGNLLTGGIVSATGNITTANALNGATLSLSGNVTSPLNVTGNIAGGNIATVGIITATGNLTAGNIDTAGTITATGNILGGNINATTNISATANVLAGNVVTTSVYSASSITLTAASGDINLDASGNIVLDGGKYINNVLDPVQAQDAATKQYVDDAVSSGIHIHTPVYVETPTALPSATYAQGGNTFTVNQTIAGNTVVFTTAANLQTNDQLWFSNSFEGIVGNTAYFVVSTPNTSAAVLSTSYNGAPVSNITSNTGLTESVRVNSGIGATLTATANGNLTIDGVTVTTTQRVLVYNQANAVQNGVYVVSDTGNVSAPWILTRASDAETYIPDSSVGLDEGSYFYVQAGDTGAGESYVMTAPTGPFIIGYDNLTFTQFSASQVYTANTAAGLSLTGTVFSAKVDNDTTAFDGGGNIIVKAGANLTTPNIGAATGTSLSLTGNLTSGNVNTGIVSASGNVVGGNISTTGLITATGNLTAGNIATAGIITATGNITTANSINTSNISLSGNVISDLNVTGNVAAGNILTVGIVSAGGNVTGGNVLTGGIVSATGNATFGNVDTAGLITATGNITGGNINTAGLITATGNLTAGNVDTAGLITATGNITGGNLVTAGLITATGNLTAGNVNTAGLITATGNLTAGNVSTAGLITATGNITGGNVDTAGLITATGNITGGNVLTGGLISATGNIFGANLILSSGTIDGPAAGRLTVNASSLDTDFAVNGDTTANILYIDAGTGTASFGTSAQTTNAVVAFNATNSILLPTGTLGQRPGTGVTGMLRFNTTDNTLEIYDNDSWEQVGATTFTVIADEQFNGDGSTVAFTLGSTQTTNSCIVSINGVVQIPGSAYSVSGVDPACVLTFTEAPAEGDLIDVRQITTTTTVRGISNSSGNAVFDGSPTAAAFELTGDIIPTANVTFSLGNNTNRFANIYLAGNTIFLGNLQLSAGAGNTFSVTTDGNTPANITGVDATSIQNGNSSISVGNLNSNISVVVNGTPVATFTATGIENNMGNGVGNIGNSTGYFNTIFAKATSAQYADLAEKYVADADYESGTVVMFGGTQEVTVCNNDSCSRVAGVISTNPSYIMNSTLTSVHVATVALTGRVPTRVTGTVRKGDLMVSAGNGSARAEADPRVGTVIGKALADFDGTNGVIEVVVGRF